ncbi:nuclear transport factor 2 family protein [Mucilaginibacter sp. UR6-1]|uniref:nuclear transport factor 2 family protein n=1 Tax=Mucilaginibacter sp. UR6-1 TaxID=1435643 RepID=UPI001E29704E|nr:nuclear transport factor 2 family protein [Mucilaginibacter sp. UR6-1]MCC8410552.1 nuclear transport factor 2 family protein [Mucilaginibacter sp. UR6-1]
MKRLFSIATGFMLFACTLQTLAQAPKTPAGKTLYNTIIGLDKQVFDAYNKCDLDKFEDYFTSNVEFFHDRTGYTSSRHDLMKSMRSLCENGGLERVLVSAQVYTLDFYGALETGVNKFYKTTNGKRKLVNTSRFIHVWKQDDDGWKISRVISYDHKAQ